MLWLPSFYPLPVERPQLGPAHARTRATRPKHLGGLFVHEVERQAARDSAQGKRFIGRSGESIAPPGADPVFISAGFEFPNTHRAIIGPAS